MPQNLATHFADPTRDELETVRADHARLTSPSLITTLLDSFPEPAVILNQHRQIVLANHKMCKLLGKLQGQILGMRVGEALNCIHWKEMDAGCGTTQFCRLCGAVQAMVKCGQSRTTDVRECRITVDTGQDEASLDLRVWATPLDASQPFTVFAVRDISAEKRRAVLERTFFHDVLDTAGGLAGLLRLWPEQAPEEATKTCQTASVIAAELVEELRASRDLVAAENGDLKAEVQDVDAGELMARVCSLFRPAAAAVGKRLAPPQISGSRLVHTDVLLMGRVLGNLVKNALEASEPGQVVSLAFSNADGPAFTVHNQSAMPRDVQLQVFQRSFTTKLGPGRGIGTYSVKLLTEKYLGGKVTFTSSPAEGTTFVVKLPG